MTALLFIDYETTALDDNATILEAAFTITDLDGTPRIPVRSRYCGIAPLLDSVIPESRGDRGEAVWDVENPRCAGDPRAKEMAVESGLFDDWLACPDSQRLYRAAELERLLLDALASGCAPGEEVHIAGSGVAQFDQPLTRQYFPRVMAPQGVQGGPLHYGPVDQSVTQRTLLGGVEDDALIAWAGRTLGAEALIVRGARLCSMPVDGPRRHRAGPDVARAVVVHRALWALSESMRGVLEIPL